MKKFGSRKFLVIIFSIKCATLVQILGSFYKFDPGTIMAYFNVLGLLAATYCAGNTAQTIFQNPNTNSNKSNNQ